MSGPLDFCPGILSPFVERRHAPRSPILINKSVEAPDAWTAVHIERERECAMPASEQDREQIAAVIEQYRRGFATLDVEALKAIWDQDYDQIIYVAQELAQPVWNWPGGDNQNSE
jgi:hypothetical protein